MTKPVPAAQLAGDLLVYWAVCATGRSPIQSQSVRFRANPVPRIWVAQSVQTTGLAKGEAGEIPANHWWAHLDSNQGPLPYQGGTISWREDPWRLAAGSTFGLGQGAAHDCRSQGHSGSVSHRGSANMPHAVACISPACRWSRCMLTPRLQARQATAGWVRRKRKSPI